MLLAIWKRHERAGLDAFASALEHWVASQDLERSGGANHLLAVRRPARLQASAQMARGEFGGGSVFANVEAIEFALGPFPQQPLYYYRAPDDSVVAVCTFLEPLARALPRRRFCRARLLSFSQNAPPADPTETPFETLRRMRPGQRVRVDANGWNSRVRLPTAGGGYFRAAPEALAEDLRGHVRDAVKRAIADETRVAVFAGGGLDSAGVLALAVAHCRGARQCEIEALSLHYASPGDDRPCMNDLSRAFGIEPVRLAPGLAGSYFARSLCMDAQPTLLSSQCLDWLLGATAVERGASVVLSGVHGDTMIGGIPHGLAALARRGHPLRAMAYAARLRLPWRTTAYTRVRDLVARPAMRAYVPRPLRRLRQRRTRHDPWLLPESVRVLESARQAIDVDPVPDTPDDWLALRCSSHRLLDYMDGGAQLTSATRCAPVDVFLDADLVKFIARVDPVTLCHGGTYRGLYRLAMKGLLPESVRLRPDKARFEPAIAEAALAGDGLARLRELSSLSGVASLGFVAPRPFAPVFEACVAAIERGMRGGADLMPAHWQKVWQLLAVEAFVREWA